MKGRSGYVELLIQKAESINEIKDENLFGTMSNPYSTKDLLKRFKPVPDNIFDKVSSVIFHDNEQFSEVEIGLNNFDNEFYDEREAYQKYYTPGVHYCARYWVDGKPSRWFTSRVILPVGGREVKLFCRETFFWLMKNKEPIQPRKEGYTFSELLEIILKRGLAHNRKDYEGLTFSKETVIDLVDEKGKKLRYPAVKTAGRTDIGFLQDLSYRFGYTFYVAMQEKNGVFQGIIHMKPRDLWGIPTSKYVYAIDYSPKSKYNKNGLPYGGRIFDIPANSVSLDSVDKSLFLTGKIINPVTGETYTVSPSLTRDHRFPATGGRYFDTFMMNLYNRYDYIPSHMNGSKLRSIYWSKNIPDKDESAKLKEQYEKNIGIIEANSRARLMSAKAKGTDISAITESVNKQKERLTQQYFESLYGSDKKRKKAYDKMKYDMNRLITVDTFSEQHYVLRLMGEIYRKMEGTRKLTITCEPRADAMPRETIEIEGTGLYDWKWYCTNVTTTFDDGGNPIQTRSLIGNSMFEQAGFSHSFTAETASKLDISIAEKSKIGEKYWKNQENNKLNINREVGVYKNNGKEEIRQVQTKAEVGNDASKLPNNKYTTHDTGYERTYYYKHNDGVVKSQTYIKNSSDEEAFIKSLESRGTTKLK